MPLEGKALHTGYEKSPLVRSLAIVCLLPLTLATGCSRNPAVRKQKYLESGTRYEAQGKYPEANIQFFNALKVDKNFAPAHYELGKSYLKMAAYSSAYSEFMTTVALAPGNMQARLDLGRLLLAAGHANEALTQANAVLAAQPNNADAYALLSGVEASKGDRQGAITQMEKALSLNGNNAGYLATLGVLKGGDPATGASAEQDLQKAIAIDSRNVIAHLALSALLEKKNDFAGAEQQLQAAVAADPKNARSRLALSAFYLRRQDTGKAEAVLRKASEDLAADNEGAAIFADYCLQTGQVSKAEQAYAAMTVAQPKSPGLKLAYARVLVAGNDFAKAGDVAKELSSMNADSPQVSMLNATLLMQQGKNNDAFEVLQKAQKNFPENGALEVMLGIAARNKGDATAAESAFRDALQRDPSNLEAARGVAEIAAQKNDITQVSQLAASTITRYPKRPDGYIWRAMTEAAQAHLDTAAADMDTALKLDPENKSAMVELAQIRLKQGKLAEGTALLNKAMEGAGNVAALRLMVGLDLQQRQPEKAIGLIQQQLARTPNSAELYDQLAIVQFATRDANAARESARKALSLNSGDLVAARLFTQAELALSDVGPAIDLWQKWAAAHPKDPQAPALLGMLYESVGDANKAIAAYQQSLALQPDQTVASNNLAYLLVNNNGNLDVALTLAQTAHSKAPDSASTTDTLAWVYYKKGLYSSALDLLQAAVKADPRDASIQYHLGMTQSRLDNKKEAADHLRQAVTLSPNSPTAQQAQQELSRIS